MLEPSKKIIADSAQFKSADIDSLTDFSCFSPNPRSLRVRSFGFKAVLLLFLPFLLSLYRPRLQNHPPFLPQRKSLPNFPLFLRAERVNSVIVLAHPHFDPSDSKPLQLPPKPSVICRDGETVLLSLPPMKSPPFLLEGRDLMSTFGRTPPSAFISAVPGFQTLNVKTRNFHAPFFTFSCVH